MDKEFLFLLGGQTNPIYGGGNLIFTMELYIARWVPSQAFEEDITEPTLLEMFTNNALASTDEVRSLPEQNFLNCLNSGK